jgi:hypothetical protein
MLKIYLFALILLITTESLLAQTKLIAHKSHSGTRATFGSFRLADGLGLGAAPYRNIKTALLDSVIYISDSVAIMVTSNYCTRVSPDYRASNDYTMEERMHNARIWEAGRDTVYNHPLFSKQHQLDTIKAILDRDYNFNNGADKVKFIGYDNGKPLKKVIKKKKSGFLPLVPSQNNRPPFDFQLLMLIGCVTLFSMLAGVISWKLYHIKMLVQKV